MRSSRVFDPLGHQRPSGLFRHRVLLGLFENRLVGRRGENGHEDRALARLQDARVAVVDRGVKEHARPGAVPAAIVRLHELHTSERTDLSLTASGIDQQQPAALAAGQGWPAMVQLGLPAKDRERNNWRIFTPLTLPSPRRGEGAADSYSFRSPNDCGLPHGSLRSGLRGPRQSQRCRGGRSPRRAQPIPSIPWSHHEFLPFRLRIPPAADDVAPPTAHGTISQKGRTKARLRLPPFQLQWQKGIRAC